MDDEVTKIKMKQTFKECPACQYSDGFHNMFERDGDEVKWLFICPACHRIYDLSLIHISEPTRPRRQSRMPSSA